MAYSYDNNGNLSQRKDNRGFTTNYSYDVLNRVQQQTYSDTTPSVTYVYDAQGDLSSVANGNSTTNYTSFDAMGWVKASSQVTQGQTYSFAYNYNLAGALTSETYPSGRTIATSYDAVSRPVTVQGNLQGQIKTYASSVSYWAHGGLYWFTAGNNVVPVYYYNNRLQIYNWWATIGDDPNRFLLNVGPDWGGTNNNGSLQSVFELYGPAVPWNSLNLLQQNYTYDNVNRLSAVSDSGYSRSFSYDAWGNMWVSEHSGVSLAGNTPTSNVFNSNNQVGGGSYDAAGNQTSVNGNAVGYDAENRQVTVTEPPALGGGTETYAYDGNGQRVLKTGPGGTTVYVYDALGQLAAEYSTAINSSPCVTCYLTWDHLGTPRIVTDQNGNVVARHDYLPFGEEVPSGSPGRTSEFGASDGVATKFTGQYRDSETGVDYFNARYFTGALGRFNSPDPMNAGADLSDPQTWNGYAYVRNNPLALVDPSGMDGEDANGGSTTTYTVTGTACQWWQFWCWFSSPDFATDTNPAPGLESWIADYNYSLSRLSGSGGSGGGTMGGGGPAQPSSPSQPAPPKSGPTFTKAFLPPNANICFDNQNYFYAPPSFDITKIEAVGKSGGYSPQAMNAAVGHYGTFDFQRVRGSGGNTTFYSGYTPVSNFSVGAYLYSAGFSKSIGSFIANTFALFKSSNAGDPAQATFRNLGYDTAARGQIPVCQAR